MNLKIYYINSKKNIAICILFYKDSNILFVHVKLNSIQH